MKNIVKSMLQKQPNGRNDSIDILRYVIIEYALASGSYCICGWILSVRRNVIDYVMI